MQVRGILLLTAQARGEDFFGSVDTVHLVATTVHCVWMLYIKNLLTLVLISVRDQHYILPIYSVLLKRGKGWCKCNCLLDSGSQKAYFSSHILKSLKCDPLAGIALNMLSVCTWIPTKNVYGSGFWKWNWFRVPWDPSQYWMSIRHVTEVLKLWPGYWESKGSRLLSCCWYWK